MRDVGSLAVYNVQIQDSAPDGMHADWSGSHAAATYEALRSFHLATRSPNSPNDAVRQVEWGAYECTLRGDQVRQLIERALEPAWNWRDEPLETLKLGRTDRAGTSGIEAQCSRTLGWLHDHLDEGHVYLLTAEIFE